MLGFLIDILNKIYYHYFVEKPKFEFYERPNGQVEFIDFLQSLPVKDRAKLLDIIQHIQEHGLLVAQRME